MWKVESPVRGVVRGVVRALMTVLVGVLVVVVGLVVWAQFSPRPSTWLINAVFAAGGVGTVTADPPAGVTVRTDVRYGPGADELLDVHLPAGDALAPVIVWVHGGGWIGGDKAVPGPYLDLFAAHGWAGIAISYSVAPDAQYPEPVRQLDVALRFIRQHGADLRVDPSRVVLAGDSAGAQIAGQYAAMVADPGYGAEVGVDPSLPRSSLRAALLHCGPYQPRDALSATGVPGWFVRTVGWAYLGSKDLTSATVDQASVTAHASPAFPPTLLSGGDKDPLTAMGRGLAARLEAQRVPVSSHWYPGLNHEFQFDLTLRESQDVLADSFTFLDQHAS